MALGVELIQLNQRRVGNFPAKKLERKEYSPIVAAISGGNLLKSLATLLTIM
jgi:hypothetical protein